MIRKIGTLLSNPAWNGVGAIATVVGLIGLSVLYFGFRDVFNYCIGWLNSLIYISRIALIITTLLPILIIGIIYAISRKIKKRKNKELPAKEIPYFSYWDVLWRIDMNTTGKNDFTGPYCPSHLLELQILRDKYSLIFQCKGLSSNEGHQIRGPQINQLILPKDCPEDISPEVLIRLDLVARISANQRRKEISSR
jgi:hypothetical protein